MTEVDSIRRLIQSEEGQHFDRESLFAERPGEKRHRDRREVRDEVAEYAAAFANADGGVLILGVEDDVVLRNSPIFEATDERWVKFVRELPLHVRQRRALVAFHDRTFQSGDYQELNRVNRDVAYRELQELQDQTHRPPIRVHSST
ncbi:MAG TPA: RNA-binding domain-containing protein [Polyangiaceae bacterium]|nr:RNA-binding domain-containing protein [Polyangiaceae bacterium]